MSSNGAARLATGRGGRGPAAGRALGATLAAGALVVAALAGGSAAASPATSSSTSSPMAASPVAASPVAASPVAVSPAEARSGWQAVGIYSEPDCHRRGKDLVKRKKVRIYACQPTDDGLRGYVLFVMR